MRNARMMIASPAALMVLFALLAGVSLLSDQIAYHASILEGKGTFTYVYGAGKEPIASIVFELPAELASAVAPGTIVGASAKLEGSKLVLTGLSLKPGESLRVEYRLTRYVGGSRSNYTATAITLSGETLTTKGSFTVTETIVLKVFTIISDNRPLAIAGSALGMAASAVPTMLRSFHHASPSIFLREPSRAEDKLERKEGKKRRPKLEQWLQVDTEPVGVHFSLDSRSSRKVFYMFKKAYKTPFRDKIKAGKHTIALPHASAINGLQFYFVRWEDGSIQLMREFEMIGVPTELGPEVVAQYLKEVPKIHSVKDRSILMKSLKAIYSIDPLDSPYGQAR